MRGGGEHVKDDTRSEGSHVRLGWGRREAPLNGPVGVDGYSYGYRDKTGEKVTLSRPRPYGRSFSSGDVIGMYIALPPRRQPNKKDPHDPAHIKRERIAIDLKGQEVFEMLEYPQTKEMTALMDYSGKSLTSVSLPSTTTKKSGAGKLPERGKPSTTRNPNADLRPIPTLPDSRISFFVNGECQGIAFQDIYDDLPLRVEDPSRKAKEKKRSREGVKEHRQNPFDDGSLGYYPFISLFNDACVQINPGPDFEHPPPADIDALLLGGTPTAEGQERTWRPICERYPEFMAEQWELDVQEEEEAKIDADRAAAQEKAEEDKRAQRNKRQQQAEARKRAKKAAAEQSMAMMEDERFGPGSSLAALPLGQPSPLRHATAYEPWAETSPVRLATVYEPWVRSLQSPAPTAVSTGDGPGMYSGYASENGDAEMMPDTSEMNAYDEAVRGQSSEPAQSMPPDESESFDALLSGPGVHHTP